jgi:hypothetical protein
LINLATNQIQAFVSRATIEVARCGRICCRLVQPILLGRAAHDTGEAEAYARLSFGQIERQFGVADSRLQHRGDGWSRGGTLHAASRCLSGVSAGKERAG